MDAEKPPSTFERFIASPRPGLPLIALIYFTLLATWAYLYTLPTWQQALQIIRRTSIDLGWPMAAILLCVWPLSTLITHLLARAYGLRAPFLRTLHATGKIWILHAVISMLVDAVIVALVSSGWRGAAEFWYILARGGITWLIYPTAVQVTYGEDARSCLLTFLTALIIALLVIGIPLLALWLAVFLR